METSQVLALLALQIAELRQQVVNGHEERERLVRERDELQGALNQLSHHLQDVDIREESSED